MKPTTVEVVFVVDASESMRPCFESLSRHLEAVIAPLQALSFRTRLGLVTHSVGAGARGGRVFSIGTLDGSYEEIYRAGPSLFTEDPSVFRTALAATFLSGDENSLVGLDCALDFPFGDVGHTRRVVVLLSDERIEDGMMETSDFEFVPKLVAKIMERRIQLFAAMPSSPTLEQIGSTDGAEIQEVSGGDGLASVDFGRLMGQMAKSISVSSLQGSERPFTKGLFGQLEWRPMTGRFDGLR